MTSRAADIGSGNLALVSALQFEPLHDEVLIELRTLAPADPHVGDRIRSDRGSDLIHLGIRTPDRRRVVKNGFSFTAATDAEVLQAWDLLWRRSEYGDVLFAVLDYYRDSLPIGVPEGFWAVASGWIDRVDNWAHADDLARVYSWALEALPGTVYPTLVEWNGHPGAWHRRISIVSLIHYSGKHSAFMSVDQVLPLVENCLADSRDVVQKAVGWVLRESADAHPEAVIAFIQAHVDELSPTALRRATEHLDPPVRVELRSHKNGRDRSPR